MDIFRRLESRDSPSRSTNQKLAFHLSPTLLSQLVEAPRISWSTAIWISSHTVLVGSRDLAQPSQRSRAISCTAEASLMMAMLHSLACLPSRHARSKVYQPQESALSSRLRRSQVVQTLLPFFNWPRSRSVRQMLASAWTQVLLTMSNSGSPVL